MKKTANELLELKMRFPADSNIDGAKLEMVVEAFDDKAVRKDLEKRYVVMTWDRKSDINGVSAQEVLENRDDVLDDGEIVLVMDGDQVLLFQPHDPDQPGLVGMNSKKAKAYGNQYRDELVDQTIDTELVQEILKKAVK